MYDDNYPDYVGAFWLVAILVGVICAVIGAIMANAKRIDTATGLFLGLFLGPLGLIIIAVMKSPHEQQQSNPQLLRECPWCKSMIRRDASLCTHCQNESKAWTFHKGSWWVTNDQGEWFWYDERTRQWVRP